jgi:hypothetical protein
MWLKWKHRAVHVDSDIILNYGTASSVLNMLGRLLLLPQRECVLKQTANRAIDLLVCLIHRHVKLLMLDSNPGTHIVAGDTAALPAILCTEYLVIARFL